MDVDLDTMPAGVLPESPVDAPGVDTKRAVVLEALYDLRSGTPARVSWRLGTIDRLGVARRLHAMSHRYPHLIQPSCRGAYYAVQDHSPFEKWSDKDAPASPSGLGTALVAVYDLHARGEEGTIDAVAKRAGWSRPKASTNLANVARIYPALLKRTSPGVYAPTLDRLPVPLCDVVLPEPPPNPAAVSKPKPSPVAQPESDGLGPLPLRFVEEREVTPRPVGCTTVEEFLALRPRGSRRGLPKPIARETIDGRKVTYHRVLRHDQVMVVATVDGREVDAVWPGPAEAEVGVRRRLGQTVKAFKWYGRWK